MKNFLLCKILFYLTFSFSNEVLRKLIDYATKMPGEDTAKIGHLFPFNSCELLCTNNSFILDRFLEEMKMAKDSDSEGEEEEEEREEEDKGKNKKCPKDESDSEEEDKGKNKKRPKDESDSEKRDDNSEEKKTK